MKTYDLVIKNGRLADPLEMKIKWGNIGIISNKIDTVTQEEISGGTEIDACGHVVCPGFIDVHAHLDGDLEAAWASAEQGITTTIGGNCGISPLDMNAFFGQAEREGYPINQAELIGQSFTVREAAGVLSPYGPATKDQIEKMCNMVEKTLDDGAIGVSLGLEYVPGSTWDEILAVTRMAAKYKRIVPIHTNLTNSSDLEHLTEIINLADETGAHIHISHFVYQYGMGLMDEALELVDKAIEKGLNISVDSGMYTSFATFIGSRVYDLEHLKSFGWKYDNLLITTGRYAGEKLNESLYHELRRNSPNESCICFTGCEHEIFEAFEKKYMMVTSDSGQKPNSHPQSRGTYPRFFRELVRERNELTLIEAIRRCTYLPATTFALPSKGALSIGFDADITIFDIDKIMDCANFYGLGDPKAPPIGIDYVIVNGQMVVKKGETLKQSFPGKAIKF